MIKNSSKKTVSAILAMTLFLSGNILTAFADNNYSTNSVSTNEVTISDYDYTYSNYIADNGSISEIYSSDTVNLSSAELQNGAVLEDYAGKQSVVKFSKANSAAIVKANIKQSGYYCFYLTYAGLTDSEKSIILSLLIDGKSPFFEADSLELSRAYVNSTNNFKTDKVGNQLRPEQIQIEKWQTSPFYQNDGGSCYPYYFYMTAGEHQISISAANGGVAIERIEFKQPKALNTYSEYLKSNPSSDAKAKDIILEGEKADLKSSASLYPVTDRTNCATQPFSEKNTMLNAIGGGNWSDPGSWVEWNFSIEAEGYYSIDLRVLQSGNKGMKSYRTITINGEVPFAELEQYGFEYNRSWYIETLHNPKDGEPFKFYFKPGDYTLRLETTTGELRDSLNSISNIMSGINSLYHSIIMITSTDPDIYRDYNLQKAIPGIEDTLGSYADSLDKEFENIQKIMGGSGVAAASIQTLADQMRNMQKLPKTISDRVTNFYSNISAVYAWLNSASSQPLEIDYIRVGTKDSEPLKANASFVKSFISGCKSFLYSFITDYDSTALVDEGERSITVWMSKGIDQAETLKQLINRNFTEKNGIQVALKLVQGGVIEAVVAGTGPDVILNQGMYNPVDYAARGILVPLDEFEDFNDVVNDAYYESSMIPYSFRGHYYAMPETMDFSMMFYRKDIIDELGIKLPNTWTELEEAMTVLTRNNMQIGVQCLTTTAAGAVSTEFPKNILTFFMQNGISLYNDDLSATNLNTTEAISTFEKFTDLYTKWGFPYYFDAANRFRTGEMPIMIASISTYNTLAISAPEIAGRWGMTLIPGTVMEDGTINRTVEFNTTSTMMFNTAKDKEACWEFIKWWVSEDTQYSYSMEVESLLGTSGRNLTANYKAFERLPWDSEISENISKQWQMASTVPMVPGYYFVSRYLTNAISDSIINGENSRTVIEKYADIIDKELERKRAQIDAVNK